MTIVREKLKPNLLGQISTVPLPRKGKPGDRLNIPAGSIGRPARRAGLKAIVSDLKNDHWMKRSRYRGWGDHLEGLLGSNPLEYKERRKGCGTWRERLESRAMKGSFRVIGQNITQSHGNHGARK